MPSRSSRRKKYSPLLCTKPSSNNAKLPKNSICSTSKKRANLLVKSFKSRTKSASLTPHLLANPIAKLPTSFPPINIPDNISMINSKMLFKNIQKFASSSILRNSSRKKVLNSRSSVKWQKNTKNTIPKMIYKNKRKSKT